MIPLRIAKQNISLERDSLRILENKTRMKRKENIGNKSHGMQKQSVPSMIANLHEKFSIHVLNYKVGDWKTYENQ